MKIFAFIVLTFLSGILYGQFPDYHVFLVRGHVEANRPGEKPAALKQKAFIFKDQTIVLKDKAEVTLSDKNNNFYVLRTAGSYKAKDLAKINNYRVPGVTEKYLTLVWNELFNTHHDYTKFTKSNIAGVYGGVSRGSECNNLVFPIADMKTAEDSLHFVWTKTSPESIYIFTIHNEEGKEVVNRQVADTQLYLSLRKDLGLNPENYYWKIKSTDGVCEEEVPVGFEVLSSDNEDRAVKLVVKDFDAVNLPTHFNNIEKLEKSGLITAARRYFKSLLPTHNADKAFVKSYILFLVKYKYNDEAKLLWEQSIGK